MTRRLMITNASANALGFLAQIAVSFVMAPITLRALGDERNGIWSVIESFLAYMLLFDLGVAASLVRFVPRFVATGDEAALNRVYSACLAFFCGIAIVAVLLGWTVLAVVLGSIAIPPAISGEVHLVAIVAIVQFAATLPLSIFPAMLDGLHAFVAKSLVRTAFLILRVPALLLALSTERALLNLVLVLAGINQVESLTMAWLVRQRLPRLRFVPGQVDRATIRSVSGYSLDAFLAMIAGRLAFQTDAFVIGRCVSLAAITHFANASRLIELAKSALRSATTTLTPAVSASEAHGDLIAVRAIVLHGTRLSLYLVLPIQIGLFMFGSPFLSLWLGPEYAAASFATLSILNLTLPLTIAQSVASRVLYGMGRIRLFARVALLEGAANLALSIALVGPYGIEGVAWGTAIPHAAFCLFVIGLVLRTLDLRLAEYLRRAWLGPVLCAIVLITVWHPISTRMDSWTWLRLIGSGIAGLLPYGATVAAAELFVHRRTPPDRVLRQAA